MKTSFSLSLILISAALLSSCKKDETSLQETIQSENLGTGSIQHNTIMRGNEQIGGPPNPLQLQSDGSYLGYWGGVTLKFTDISVKTAPYQDGDHVGSISISTDPSSGATVSSDGGAYFSGYRLVYGMPPGYMSGLLAYRSAYSNYIFDTKNAQGQLLQPNIPLINDYVPSISGQTSPILGKVVMWKNSESGLAVVSYGYVGKKASSTPPVNAE